MSSFGPHLASGIIIGAIATAVPLFIDCNVAPVYLYGLPLLTGISGALTPDMDIKSKSSQLMYLLYLIFALSLYWIGRIELGFLVLVYAILPQFCKHRGFIHSVLFGFVSGFCLFLILKYNSLDNTFSIICASSYLTGFFTHLILDDA